MLGVGIVLSTQEILPDKYFYDSEHIRNLIDNYIEEDVVSISYLNTANFYRAIGFNYNTPVYICGLFNYTVSFLLLSVLLVKSFSNLNRSTFIILLAWNALLAIYMSMYTKELIAYIFSVLVLFLAGNKNFISRWVGIVTAVSIYAALFRPYWTLVILLAILIVALRNSLRGIDLNIFIKFIAYLSVMVLVVSVLYVYMGGGISDIRMQLNEGRESDPDSITIISNPILHGGFIGDVINIFVVWGGLLFPIGMLAGLDLKHALFSIIQMTSVVLFAYAVYVHGKARSVGAYLTNRWQISRIEFSIAWCISFSFVQSFFEPDYGSFVRHETVLMPFLIYIIQQSFEERSLLKRISQ